MLRIFSNDFKFLDGEVLPQVSEIPSQSIKKALKHLESEFYREFTE